MKNKIYLSWLPVIFMLIPAAGTAQELQERLEVRGKYISDNLPVLRLERLPEFQRFRAKESVLDYSFNGVNADFSPSSPDAVATVWGAKRRDFNPRGYVDLSLGSFLNSDLSAGYSILSSSSDALNLRLQHNSTSLWRAYGADSPRRKSYQEEIGVDYSHLFKGAGRLDIDAQYHFGYFNYYGGDPVIIYPSDPMPGDRGSGVGTAAPTQTLNDASFRIGWSSWKNVSGKKGGGIWNLALGCRYYGYRTATRESDIILEGGFTRSLRETASIGMDARGDLLLYNTASAMPAPDSYGILRLTPFYRWHKGQTMLRIGADLDFSFNADATRKGEHYGAFHAAPDVRFDLTGKNVGLYIHLLGGTELQTLAATSQLDPYRNPQLSSTCPTYTPVDASLGLTLTPFSGFKAAVNLRYKVMKNVWAGGWYAAVLDYGHLLNSSLNIPNDVHLELGDGLQRYNLAGFGIGMDLSYELAGILRMNFNGTYTPQHDATGIFNGLDRPRWILNASVGVNPIDPLSLSIGYHYRGVRRIYATWIKESSAGHESGSGRVEVSGMPLPDISDLNFSARWSFSEKLAVSFQIQNILDRKPVILPGLPGEGITFYGGMEFYF